MGGSPETTTVTFKNQTVVLDAGADCDGNLGAETRVFNGVLHQTVFPDGHYSFEINASGTWALDTYNPSLPDWFGRFTGTTNRSHGRIDRHPARG
jgi:hypothetical protein